MLSFNILGLSIGTREGGALCFGIGGYKNGIICFEIELVLFAPNLIIITRNKLGLSCAKLRAA